MPPRPSADELDRIDQTLTAGPASRSWPAPDIAHTAGLGAAVHETHIGIVLLLGDRAYKLKKPVRTPFLDFSTREQRLAALQQELRLNRRLAPDVYLGLADVSAVSPDGGPVAGDPAEHVLVMRRMPADRRLATLVRSGADVDEDLRDEAEGSKAVPLARPTGYRSTTSSARVTATPTEAARKTVQFVCLEAADIHGRCACGLAARERC